MPTQAEIERIAPIEQEAYDAALAKLNNGLEVIVDPVTGKQFEVGILNEEAGDAEDADAEISTYSSSLSGNIGNAVEFAEHSATQPNRMRIYIANMGNGKSSYWNAKEIAHIKQTGRFVGADGEVLPTIAALQRALTARGITVTRYSTDSAGGAIATALMHASEEGQVTHGYIKSRTNLVDHRPQLAWGIGMLIGDAKDDGKYKAASNDPWKMTPEMISAAKEAMPNIYGQDNSQGVPTAASTLLKIVRENSHMTKKYWDDMIAYGRGERKDERNPAAADTTMAIEKQPDVLLTYHFPTSDRLYSPDVLANAHSFLQQIHLHRRNLDRSTNAEALLMPGGHRDHTSYPALRWSMEAYAFGRTR